MHCGIETLESRIVPATLLANGKGLVYTDVDGDIVTLRVSKGQLSPADIVFDTPFDSMGPQQLQLLNLSDDDQEFAGATVVVSAKPVGGKGDGLANVGFISAKGVDLLAVRVAGDLGRIEVGDDDGAVIGIKTLRVQSMGLFGSSTQQVDGSLRSFAYGGIGSLNVAGDFREAEFNTLAAGTNTKPEIGSIKIGGSIVGGAKTFSGQIYSVGSIGTVRVGGDLRGGSAAATGQISAGTTIGNITIGGDLIGGSYDSPVATADSGAIITGRDGMESGDVGTLRIGGSIIGGAGDHSGRINIGVNGAGKLGFLTIGEDLAGGGGEASGVVSVDGALDKLRIGGDVRGGKGEFSGSLSTFSLGTAFISGDVKGDGPTSARILSSNTGKLTLGGSLIGGEGAVSGSLGLGSVGSLVILGDIRAGSTASGSVGLLQADKIVVKGSLIGGTDATQPGISVIADTGSIVIGGDIRSARDGTGFIATVAVGEDLGRLIVRGSILVGDGATPVNVLSARSVGSVNVLGDVEGDANSPAQFRILGSSNVPTDLGSFTIGGSFESAILSGGDGNSDGVQFGKIRIGQDFIASRIAVSTQAGNDMIYGTQDDTFLKQPGQTGRIAEILIKGQALGTASSNDSFQIVAEEIGKISVRGVTLPLAMGTVPVGSTGDLEIRFDQ